MERDSMLQKIHSAGILPGFIEDLEVGTSTHPEKQLCLEIYMMYLNI